MGFCYLFKREVFDKVGFLDEQFSPGNFEDDDYSLRILQQGWDLLFCHDTFIHHFGHASFSKGYGDQEAAEKARRSNALIERNAALFLKKWHVPERYKFMAVEEVRRLLQSHAGADGAVHERRLPREKKIVVLLRDSHIFQDESIGMVGFLGSASLPVSGSLMDSPYKYGAVYVPTEEDFSEMRFGTAVQAAADVRYDVRYILTSFFATQWDIPWDESYEKQYYAVLAYLGAERSKQSRSICRWTGCLISFETIMARSRTMKRSARSLKTS